MDLSGRASAFILTAVLACGLPACSSGGSSGNGSAEAGPTCGIGGVYSVRFFNDGAVASGGTGCSPSLGGAFTLHEAGSDLSSAGWSFATCSITSSTTSCPSHISAACSMSGGINGPGPQSGATIEIDTDESNNVTGQLTIMYTSAPTCIDSFTGTRDPNG